VKVLPEKPTALAGLYLAASSDTQIVYDYGSKLSTNFRGVLMMAPTSTGTQGTWAIINWFESGGLVTSQNAMKRIITEINDGLCTVDPKARLL
jgi:hypothetical protein